MATIALPGSSATPLPCRLEPLKVWRRRFAASILRCRVPSRDFSIISNDCWGGMAYEELGARYESPCVGLFILPEDYLRMLSSLRASMEAPLQFRSRSRHDHINQWRAEIKREYPIGVLPGEVEVQFLHYRSVEEARTKWSRRAARINWRKLRVKISWHDTPRMPELIRAFEALPFEARIVLAPRPVPEANCCVALPDFSTDGTQQYYRCHKAMDVAAFLEHGRLQRGGLMRPLNWLLYWKY